MGTGWKYEKKPTRRPKKSEGERRRRVKTQKARLVGLGMDEGTVAKMDPQKVRELLKRPAAVQKQSAA